ncbi:MAG: HD domain-containing protein [Aureliella sp.]
MKALPELAREDTSPIRLPGEQDVLVTPRVKRILDTPAMQRLRGVSQLGLVSQVYPGATHSRFEHSLGVFRLAVSVLKHLLETEDDFSERLTLDQTEVFLLASLLHDVGHWPYCHPIEDIQLDSMPEHEQLARELICNGSIAECITGDWSASPSEVANFLNGDLKGHPVLGALASVLSGPVDIDKMDYLQRDSLHAGVPYGRNFDQGRLIQSFCIDRSSNRLAITSKGKTAAEMMVFARYVMFSEVYWHHTVRSVTAMLQRLVYELRDQAKVLEWVTMSDAQFASWAISQSSLPSASPTAVQLAEGLFSGRRAPFKRLGQFSFNEQPDAHRLLAGRPYDELHELACSVSRSLCRKCGVAESDGLILLDAPPVKLEVQFKLQVVESTQARHSVPLASISPVVNSLATEQFDQYVKKVRIFAAPELHAICQVPQSELIELLAELAAK